MINSGEMENAIRFAIDLEKSGYSAHFLAFPPGTRFIRNYSSQVDELRYRKDKNYIIFKEVCQKIRPDWILIADGSALDFWFGPKHLFELEWIIDNPVNTRYATFDNFGLSFKKTTLALCNNPAVEEKFRLLNTTDLTEKMPVLVPCPFSFPHENVTNAKSNIFYYRRSAEGLELDEIQKRAIREALGLDNDEKLIFFSISRWPLQLAQALTENISGLLNHFSHIIDMIFQNVQNKTTLIVVSTYPLFSSEIRGNLKIINLDYLRMNIYHKYLSAADLFVTTSALSDSIIKAVMSEIPAAAFISSGSDFRVNRSTPPEMQQWFEIAEERFPDLLKPYYVFPSGWNEVVISLFKNNPFAKTFEFLDMLNPVETIKTINELLSDSEKKRIMFEHRKNYMDKIVNIRKPAELIKKLS